jgi:hypothetical protein
LLISLFCTRKHFCNSVGESSTDTRNPSHQFQFHSIYGHTVECTV